MHADAAKRRAKQNRRPPHPPVSKRSLPEKNTRPIRTGQTSRPLTPTKPEGTPKSTRSPRAERRVPSKKKKTSTAPSMEQLQAAGKAAPPNNSSTHAARGMQTRSIRRTKRPVSDTSPVLGKRRTGKPNVLEKYEEISMCVRDVDGTNHFYGGKIIEIDPDTLFLTIRWDRDPTPDKPFDTMINDDKCEKISYDVHPHRIQSQWDRRINERVKVKWPGHGGAGSSSRPFTLLQATVFAQDKVSFFLNVVSNIVYTQHIE